MITDMRVEHFHTNNKDLKSEDIAFNFQIAEDSLGIVHTRFKTRAKYYVVEDGGTSVYLGVERRHLVIEPDILDENGVDLRIDEPEKLWKHPDWFRLEISVEVRDESYIDLITPLKYEYHVAHIPIHIALGNEVI